MDTFYYGTVNCVYKFKKKLLKWKGNHLISIFTLGRQRALTDSRSNDKTIIELSYRKVSWFVSVSQILSPLTNHDILLNIVE